MKADRCAGRKVVKADRCAGRQMRQRDRCGGRQVCRQTGVQAMESRSGEAQEGGLCLAGPGQRRPSERISESPESS